MNYLSQLGHLKTSFLIFLFLTLNGFTYSQNIPPIAVCNQHMKVGLAFNGTAKIYAENFDAGSTDTDSIFFKALRVNDNNQFDGGCLILNGDDNPATDQFEIWFDDDVFYCAEDLEKDLLTVMRVFDKNPGNGAINPLRMAEGGDLYGHYNDCWTIVNVEYKLSDDIPKAICNNFKQVSLNPLGKATIKAYKFDNGSFNNNYDSLFFKAIRSKYPTTQDRGCLSLNGDGNSNTDSIDVWFDDDVYYCLEDVDKKVYTELRVFYKDPGTGPVTPSRMEEGGDLYGYFSSCWTVVTVKNKFGVVLPVPVCESYKTVSLAPNQTAKLNAESFDNGSYDPGNNSIYFKILRVKNNTYSQYDGGCSNLNGDDDPSTNTMDVWFDDDVYYCSEDEGKTIPTGMRVFNKDPGNGSVDPERMEEGGDLHGHYSDCITNVFIKNKLNSNITAVCEKYIQVNIDVLGKGKINAENFDDGSFSSNNNKVYFKAMRSSEAGCSDLNGDDDPSTNTIDVWYDDKIYYCCEDVTKEIFTTLLVFDKNPGSGAIDPLRLQYGGDLFGHYSNCISSVAVYNTIPPSIQCKDFNVSCTESLDPEINTKFKPEVFSVCGHELEYNDQIISFTNGRKIIRKWAVYANDKSAYCYQIIKVEATEPFDPCTIQFPEDLVADCIDNLVEAGKPKWDETSCNVVTAEYADDTFIIENNYYKIVRNWAVVDWCLYKPNQGSEDNIDIIQGKKLNCNQLVEDGYYRYTQVIIVNDTIAPIPVLVDKATVVMNDGYSDIKARTYDKGGCGIGCISSFDNCTASNNLAFSYSEFIPNISIGKEKWDKQFAKYGKYYFSPKTGLISTEAKYLEGLADAWLPSQNTTQRRYLCKDYSEINKIKVYVWDRMSCYNNIFNSFNYGFVDIDFKNCGSGISSSNDEIKNTKLYQNTPNPFSEKTKIRFDLPNNSKYNLSIFDIDGVLIYSESKMGKEGKNSVEIDGQTFSNMTGIFFYKLESESFVEIKKMVKF